MPIVKQEVIDDCKIKVSFSYEKDKVSSLIDEMAVEINKTHTVQGFRKGRATKQSIIFAYKKQILENVKQKLLNESFQDSLFELEVKAFGQPQINDIKVTLDSFTADLTIGHMPKFELLQYRDFEIERPEDLPQREVLEDMLKEKVCEQYSSQSPFEPDDFLLNGDVAVINYSGTIEGKPFEGSEAQAIIVTLGSGKSIAGFEDQLIGAKPGETREFDLDFADDFSVKELAGKTVKFKTEILSASRKAPHPYNEELAIAAGVSSLEELEQEVEKQAQQRLDEHIFNAVRPSIARKLLQANPVEVPLWQIIEVAKQIAVQNKLDWNSMEDSVRSQIIMEAHSKIRISFIFEKIKDTVAECVLSTEEMLTILNANIGNFEPNVRKELEKGTNVQLFQTIFGEIQDQHILRWLVTNSKVVAKKVEEFGQEQSLQLPQEVEQTKTAEVGE